jgi:hypothetical protein
VALVLDSGSVQIIGYGPLFANDFSFWWHRFLFFFRNETLFNIPKKHPVQDKVYNQQGSEYQT